MRNTNLSLILVNDYSWRDEHRAEDEYLVQLRSLGEVQLKYTPAYKLTHNLPAFSHKVRYHEHVFMNAVTDYLNRFGELLTDPDENYIAYHLKKHTDRTRLALNGYYRYLLKQKNLWMDMMEGSCEDYYKDRTTKESITVASYMFWGMIYCNMEVQKMFAKYMRPDNVLTVEEHFYRLLMIPPIKPICVEELEQNGGAQMWQPNQPNIPSVEMLSAYLPDVSDIIIEELTAFRDLAEPGGFFRLPKVQALDKQKQVLLIHKLQTAVKPFCFAIAHHLEWYTYMEANVVGYQDSGKRAWFFAELFGVGEREAKGHINVLKPDTKENKDRYLTCSYLKDAEDFYNSLLQ